jgi:integrase
MTQRPYFISYAREDRDLALWLRTALQSDGFDVFLDVDHIFVGSAWEQEIDQAINTSVGVIVLVSPDSRDSKHVLQEVNTAKQHNRPIYPFLIRETDPLPWYLQELHIADFTTERDRALRDFMHQPSKKPRPGLTFGEARDTYLNRATLKSPHTVDSYGRAITLFFDFLADRSGSQGLPLQKEHYVLPEDIPVSMLSEDDTPLFLHFAQWLLSPSSGKTGDQRPYKPSTVELRIAGVQNWFQFLDDYGWLPGEFKLAKAKRIVRDELRGRPSRSGPPSPPEHIEEVIYYYDALELPKHLRKPEVDQDRVRRWELTRLRNRALSHALAETGGRISEILSLNLDDFPERYLHKQEVLRVEVIGKGGHAYYLRFFDSLPAIRDYIHARGSDLRAIRGDVPLFVSHDPRYDGSRMSRIVAWRIVQRAARALGLRSITPHDFRHWRATQLINAGHSLDVVQDYLGHRSVETTRSYYAHTDPLRVDDAAKNTGLPKPEDNPPD